LAGGPGGSGTPIATKPPVIWERLGVFQVAHLPFFGESSMSKLINGLKRFVREEEAPTMVEYGLLVVLIALVVVAGATLLGTAVNGTFTDAAGKMP
jgi:pilus assembly protein Flp/PilA